MYNEKRNLTMLTDFYEFTPDDVELIDYETHPQIKNIPVAV